MDYFQKEFGEWADKTFPEATSATITEKLRREVLEFIETNDPMEAVDCFLVLLHHAHINGYSLLGKGMLKFEVVKNREWSEPDEMGVRQHIPKDNGMDSEAIMDKNYLPQETSSDFKDGFREGFDHGRGAV